MSKYEKSPSFILGAVISAFSLCVVAVLIMLAAVPAHADPEDLASQQAEAERIRGEITGINLEAEQAVERYNQASVDLDNTQQRIDANEQALQEATINLAQSRQRLNDRVENIYRNGSISMLDVLMNTSSFSEFVSRFELLGRISDQDKTDLESVQHYKSEVESIQSDLEQSRSRQEELVGTLASEQAEVESQLSDRQTLLNGVESNITDIMAQQEAEAQQAAAAQQAAMGEPTATDAQAVPNADETQPVEEAGDTETPAADDSEEPPPPSNGGVVDIAMQYIGVPYVWGGDSPAGFDCSGLVMYVFAQVGIYLPHSAASQYYSGTPVSYDELARGDLVFFGSPISHVGIYIGGGSMIHAPFEGAVVSTASVSAGGTYAGACRI